MTHISFVSLSNTVLPQLQCATCGVNLHDGDYEKMQHRYAHLLEDYLTLQQAAHKHLRNPYGSTTSEALQNLLK